MTNVDTERLKPCPFCGNTKLVAVVPFEGEPFVPGFMVRCNASGFDGDPAKGCGSSSGWAESEAEAIAAWNRRASTPAGEPVAEKIRNMPVPPDHSNSWQLGYMRARKDAAEIAAAHPQGESEKK